jgi:tetratricopeptide (TPR) repeat protein
MSSRLLILCLLLPGVASADGADKTARIIERYKQMLAANPVEGAALDQLWKTAQESSAAAQLLDEYQAAGKNDFAGALIYGHLLRKAGRVEEARGAFRQAATLDEKSALPHLALADSFAGEPKEAAGELEKAAALNPSPEVLLKLGTAWLSANEPEKAAEAWERTVALNPDDLNVRQQLAETYVSNALLDKAIPHLETIEAHGEVAQRANALRSLAQIHQARGETDAAVQALEKGIALAAPGNWLRSELQRQLIRLCQRSHRTGELEARWKDAAVRNPRDIGVYLQLIELYENLADLAQQRAWLEKLTGLAPKNQEYKMKLARVLVQLNETDGAAKIFDEITGDQPANAEAVFGRAEIDLRSGNPDEAKRRIEELLELKKHEESLVTKAVDFYSRHRMPDMVEQHLKEGAARSEEGILALAGFYFSERKTVEASATLQKLVKTNDTPEAQAAAHVKIANALREQNAPDAAIAELRLAVKLQPKSADYRVALAESLIALNRFDEAQAGFEQALSLSEGTEARTGIDRKLFQLLQIRSAQKEPQSRGLPLDAEGRIDLLSIPVPSPAPAAMRGNAPLQKYIAAMTKTEPGKPEDALRAARWLTWSRRNKEALVFARKAIAMDPNLASARELAAQIASAEGQLDVAMKEMHELIRANPSGERFYRRRMGQLQQESGDVEGALATFVELEKSKPGDVEALGDLALAQQQANRWSDALATWQRAYELSPVSKRRDLLRPLLRAMEHLQLSTKAAELLLKAVDEQSDAGAQSALFQDLLAHCANHHLLPWLEDQFRRRHQSHPDDYFTEVALAKILKVHGRHTEALALLSDAACAAPDEADALRELAREAEEAGDFATAIRHQSRLVVIAPQDDPSNLEKLAALQEDWLDLDAATRTWEMLVARFPRDPAALEHAAEFFQTWNDAQRSREVLRKVRALDPANTAALINLGQLAQDAGDTEEALGCYEQILSNSDGEREGDAIHFPAVKAADQGKLQQAYLSALRWRDGRASAETMHALSGFWSDENATAGKDTNARLTAIREISRILQSKSSAQKNWLLRWQAKKKSAPGEALWAFYYSGASDLTLNHLTELMQRTADKTKINQAFVWLALQMGGYGRLSGWMRDAKRTPEERDLLLIAMTQLLDADDAGIDPKLIGGLFPPDFKQRYLLWQMATLFARHNRFGEAAQLGQRVFDDATTDRAAYGVELAHWHICTGNLEDACRVLLKSIGGTADAFDSPVFEALREYFGLLPENERAAFVESYAKSVEDRPLHAAIAMALLRGLQGEVKLAQDSINRLLDLRAVTLRTEEEGAGSHRSWNFILAAGVQLQQWKLDAPAIFLWERAVADEAMIRLQGAQAAEIAREIRMRLLAARLQRAGAVEGTAMIEDFARSAPGDVLIALGGLLQGNGALRESVAVYQFLWKRQPKNPQFLSSLLNACGAANDRETAKSALVEMIAAGPSGLNPESYRELVMKLATLLSEENDSRGAAGLLETALASAPGNKPLLLQLAREYERTRQWDRAADVYRRMGDGGTFTDETITALARALMSSGKREAAIETLVSSGISGVEVDAMLAGLYVDTGQLGEALRVGMRLARSGAHDKLTNLASSLASKGWNKPAAALLECALRKASKPGDAFNLQVKIIGMVSPCDERSLFDRLMRRLENIVRNDPENLDIFRTFQQDIAEKNPLEEEFSRRWIDAWRNGGGTVADGMMLAEYYSRKNKSAELRGVCAMLIAKRDIDSHSLGRVNWIVAHAGFYDLAAKSSDLLCRRNPGDVDRALECIRDLHRSGQNAEALSMLENLRAREVFDDTITGRVAEVDREIGNTAEARKAFVSATRADPLAKNYRVHLAYALFLAEENQFSAAKKILRDAFRNPANHEVGEIVKVYAAAGKMDRVEDEIGEFQLAPSLVPSLRAALFAECDRTGKFAAALMIAQNHPEIIPASQGFAGRLCSLAGKTGSYTEVAAVFEKAMSQSDDRSMGWIDDAARFYKEWADKELSTFHAEAAIEHLKRANEIRPGRFDIAQQLCNLYLEQKQRERAEQVLENFLSASADEADREKARQMLAAIRREQG